MIMWCPDERNGLHNASSSGVDPGMAGLTTTVREDRESDQTARTARPIDIIAKPIARLRHFFRLPDSAAPNSGEATAGGETATIASGDAVTGTVSKLGRQAILNLPFGNSIIKGSSLPSLR